MLAVNLADAGISVPPGEPEQFDVRPTKRVDVPYEHLMIIIAALPSRLPEAAGSSRTPCVNFTHDWAPIFKPWNG